MSFPLKRRIARAALLVAAAAPVIGMGATAASAAGQPQAAGLGGLSKLDHTLPLNTVDKNAAPVTKEAAGTISTALDQATDQTSTSLHDGHLVSSALPVHTSEVPHASNLVQRGSQSLHELPLEQLPSHGLPFHGLPFHEPPLD